jgi:hypothetical protein
MSMVVRMVSVDAVAASPPVVVQPAVANATVRARVAAMTP